MHCNVCQAPLGAPIYESDSDRSLTSLCQLQPVRCRVWLCRRCAHLRSAALADQVGYYATEYRISLDADDEDQIYEVVGDRIVYRTEHQVATLLERLPLQPGALLLDYGCAKASTMRKLVERRPDVAVHLFDVSSMYRGHWEQFVPLARTAVDATPPDWNGKFDVVTSFFAIEHIADPIDAVARIVALLKPGGILYGIVPDTFGNPADFVVTDHVNHFTIPSLARLLAEAGLGDVQIDAGAHRGALVFTARKTRAAAAPVDVDGAVRASLSMAAYWKAMATTLRDAEDRLGSKRSAIYGSGFYGCWIATTLARPERVACFLDRSPYQQGKVLFGVPVVPVEELPEDVGVLYVGLNPRIARAAIGDLGKARPQPLELVFLDGPAPS